MDDGGLGGEPADSSGEVMVLQPDENSAGQADVVTFPPWGSDLAAFDAGELLMSAVIPLIDQESSAKTSRPTSSRPRLLVAQCVASPFRATVQNTLTSPYPGNQTTVPVAVIGCSANAFGWPWSRCTWRFPLNRVTKIQPNSHTFLKFSTLAYQP